jgi:hypothetical protein
MLITIIVAIYLFGAITITLMGFALSLWEYDIEEHDAANDLVKGHKRKFMLAANILLSILGGLIWPIGLLLFLLDNIHPFIDKRFYHSNWGLSKKDSQTSKATVKIKVVENYKRIF